MATGHPNNQGSLTQVVKLLYPDLNHRTYCVPPVHFNQMPYIRRSVAQQPVLMMHQTSAGPPPPHDFPPVTHQPMPPPHFSLWTQETQPQATPASVQDSDVCDDFAQNHVLTNMKELGDSRQEVMFILSQFSFGSYLSQSSHAATAAIFPLPSDLAAQYRRGDFDVLLIHRHYGILIGEIKSVGRNQAALCSPQAKFDADVSKRLKRAVKQLDKSETMVKHLVSDIAPGLIVRKTLFLPYVSSGQLLRVLTAEPLLEQAVCQSLGAADAADATKLCVCCDQLSDPATYWHVTPVVLSRLTVWWQHRMTCSVDPHMNDGLYLGIVARFVGPATSVDIHCSIPPRVEVRTARDVVKELGQRLARLVMTPQQLDLITQALPLVCVTGPPGTGKTVVLIMMGLEWLLHGDDVHVVSAENDTLASSYVIRHQLQMTLAANPTASPRAGTVCMHQYDFNERQTDVEKAISDLIVASRGRKLHVLMDEVAFSHSKVASHYVRMINELVANVPQLYLWMADVYHVQIPPALQVEALTVPLRCAPVVLREVQPGIAGYNDVHSYTDGLPFPGDGLRVLRLSHHGKGHSGQWPVDCPQCGQNVADVLRHQLGVGCKENPVTPNSPTALQFRDVFVLTRSNKLQDDVMDDRGNVTSPASGVVRGLRAAGLPVHVIGGRKKDADRWEQRVEDVALAQSDRVTVAFRRAVSGLERKVVVWLPGRIQGDDDGRSDEDIEGGDRLLTVSRCTTQLVMVDTPRTDTNDAQSNVKSQ